EEAEAIRGARLPPQCPRELHEVLHPSTTPQATWHADTLEIEEHAARVVGGPRHENVHVLQIVVVDARRVEAAEEGAPRAAERVSGTPAAPPGGRRHDLLPAGGGGLPRRGPRGPG